MMKEARVSEVASSDARVMVVEATSAFPAPVPVRMVFAAAEVRPVPPLPTAIVEDPVSALPPVPNAKPVMVVAPVPPFVTASVEVASAEPLERKRVPLFVPHLRLLPI